MVGPFGMQMLTISKSCMKTCYCERGASLCLSSHPVLDAYSLCGIFITEAQISLTEVGGERTVLGKQPESGGELRSISKAELYS